MTGPMDEAERDRRVIALLSPYVFAPVPTEDELDAELAAADRDVPPEVTEARIQSVLAVPDGADRILEAERRAS